MNTKLLSTNTLDIDNRRIDQLTAYGDESPRYHTQAETLWQAVLEYYKTGISPLVGACVYKQDGSVVLNRNIGHLDAAQNQTAGTDTPVCLFSVSKMITAILIHKLAELGKLNLNDKVVRYLPKYTGGGKDATSISDLLTHHGGIPRLETKRNEQLDPNLLFDKQGIMDLLYSAPLVSKNGATMSYHALSAGYLLGEIAEVVCGQSLEALLQTHISKPMALTSLHYGLPEEKRALAAKNVVTGLHPKLGADIYITHVLSGGMQTAVDFTNHDMFYDAFCPAGNVFSTTQDIAKFMLMLLNQGRYQDKQILQPKTVSNIRHAPYGWRFDYTLMVPMRYGQGVMRGGTPVGLFGPMSAKSFGHLGFTNIFCWADPKRGYAASFVNTGKAVVGTHLPALVNVMFRFNRVL